MDEDDGSGGRAGRVRKKSAKVLEMEEFEQAEKGSHIVKKGKSAKTPTTNAPSLDDNETIGKLSGKKGKTPKSDLSNLEITTPPVKTEKIEGSLFSESSRSKVPAELTLRTPQPQTPQSPTSGTKVADQLASPESAPTPTDAATISSLHQQPIPVKKEDPKSVIKYLLNSPTAGSPASNKIAVPPTADSDSLNNVTPKTVKKPKSEEKSSKSKPKEKKCKIEIMSPSELMQISSAHKASEGAAALKMKITGGSNPMKAQVALNLEESSPPVKTKQKKASKKVKVRTEEGSDIKPGILGLAVDEGSQPPVKKLKVSKKKEKLIQDAISAVQQMPNLAALVAAGEIELSPPAPKTQKKKIKVLPPIKRDSLMEVDLQDDSFDAEPEEESTLVIAEKEKKKKKVLGKKKASKGKDGTDAKEEKAKKIPKRAPTAYMLFCNTHRPSIVADNPGIEFAGISRKLGELWQGQSNKQKLSWRRKAQRRMKKSNLISTGKIGKESQGASAPTGAAVTPPSVRLSSHQKLASLLQKHKGILEEEEPLSPTKNFSIEPMDVAAHLKLLGESLSIIGMRLQEHKGMIAVQGSLSVLLDSLICACGPLLCLTQQVPGMDGCSPLLHAQTLDSVAYVMPGL